MRKLKLYFHDLWQTKRDALHMHEVRILHEDLCQFSVKQNITEQLVRPMSGQQHSTQQIANANPNFFERVELVCVCVGVFGVCWQTIYKMNVRCVYGTVNCFEYYDTLLGILCFIMENINSFCDMKTYIACKYLFIYFVSPFVLFCIVFYFISSIFINNDIDFQCYTGISSYIS